MHLLLHLLEHVEPLFELSVFGHLGIEWVFGTKKRLGCPHVLLLGRLKTIAQLADHELYGVLVQGFQV